MEYLFYLFALIAVIASFRVITCTSPIHALLYLILSLIAISAIFFLLHAYFAAALEIIVYAGAIMVLFVFVIMMLNLGHHIAEQERVWLTPRAWLGSSFLAVILLILLIISIYQTKQTTGIVINTIDAKQVGIQLFGAYILIVELASMLLLAGVVVAYHIGRPHFDEEEQNNDVTLSQKREEQGEILQ